MTDDRRNAARAAYDGVEHPYHLFEHIYAVCDAMLAYDAAHPNVQGDKVRIVGEHTIRALREGKESSAAGVTLIPADDLSRKPTPPLVGGDPPLSDRDREMYGAPSLISAAQQQRDIDISRKFSLDPPWWQEALAEGLSQQTRTGAMYAVLRVAIEHLTDDAAVDAGAKAEAKFRLLPNRGGMRAALAAAGKALMGDADG